MFNRPRCRDWSPLATQQLRLRNLIQITGHNIKAEPKSFLYYTLHLTPMSAPFFTSEKLESHNNAIWPDINCQSIVKSASRSFCIRIWQSHIPQDNHLTHNNNKSNPTSYVNDKILFAWNVYLSGLIPISKRTDVKLNENSLIFHIHGGFFTAAECLNKESFANQLNYVMNSDYKQTTSQLVPQFEEPYVSALNTFSISRSPSNLVLSNPTISNSYNNSGHVDVANETTDTHIPRYLLNRRYSANPNGIKEEYIYVTGDTAEAEKSYFEKIDSDEYPFPIDTNALKVRFLEKQFYKLEIRPSYSVDKLLLLQEKQRKFKYKSENAKEVMEKICMKSAFCLNLELISNKAMLYRPRGNPSMGRTLNRLLFVQPDQPKPEVLLEAQELRRRIESAKFRCRFLSQERNKYKINLRLLKTRCNKNSDENIDKECSLMSGYRGLSRNKELANEQHIIYLRQREMFSKLLDTLFQRQKQLMYQLKAIYSIESCSELPNVHTINNIYLPNADAYVDGSSGAVTTPTSICVALGYVAHIVLLCSSLLNIPLRNKIIYKGSASRMRDDIKVISEQNREFPLYCRSIPPPDSLLYAVFLLNQNIAQIKFSLNLHNAREDIRETLPNLRRVLNAAEISAKNLTKGAMGNKISMDAMNVPRASVSESSIDISVPVPIKNVLSLSADNVNADIRNSRTVISYSDQKLDSRLYLNDALHPNAKKIQFCSEPILSKTSSSSSR